MSAYRPLVTNDRDRSWTYVPLIRFMVGWVFVFNGVRRFLEPEVMGAGLFAEIGLLFPEVLAPIVGGFELVCGLLVLLGFFTRLGAAILAVGMLLAIGLTKAPVFLSEGLVEGLHTSRLDITLLLAAVFLVLVGSGPWSVDRLLAGRR